MASKKVFLGSLYEFVKPDEAVQELHTALPDSDSSPFIIYEKGKKLFSYEDTDVRDATFIAPIALIDQLSSYVERNKGSAGTPSASPRLKPTEGTYLHQAQRKWTLPPGDQNSLFEHDSTSDDGAADELGTAGPVRTYWQPKDAGPDILPEDFAAAVANATGCFLVPEPASRGIKLLGGNVEEAVRKLRNLEPLLTYMARQREGLPRRLNANILVLSTRGTQGAVKFAHLRDQHPGIDRIILPSKSRGLINQILVPEARYRNDDVVAFQKPLNLDLEGVEPAADRDFSRLFAAEQMPMIGLAESAEVSVAKTLLATNFPLLDQNSAGAHFLGPNQAARVAQWSNTVEPGLNPDACVGKVQDEEKGKPRQRVIEDSDPESDTEAGDGLSQKIFMPRDAHPRQSTDDQPPLASKTNNQNTSQVSDKAQHSHSHAQHIAAEEVEHSSHKTHRNWRPTTQTSPVKNAAPKCAHSNFFDLLGDGSDPVSSSDKHDEQPLESTGVWGVKPLESFRAPDAESPQTSRITSGNRKYSTLDDSDPFLPGKSFSLSDYTSPKWPSAKKSTLVYDVATLESMDRLDHAVEDRTRTGQEKHTLPSKSTEFPDPVHIYDRDNIQALDVFTDQTILPRKADTFLRPGDDLLIDFSDGPPVPGPVVVPPGYNYRSDLHKSQHDAMPAASSTQEIISSVVPPQRISSREGKTPSDTTSSRSEIAYIPRPIVRQRNVDAIRRQRAAGFQQNAKLTAIDGANIGDGASGGGKDNALTPPRKYQSSEDSPRRYHKTMNQKAPNPGRAYDSKSFGRPLPVKETKKGKEARIAQAMADAYGGALPAKPANQASTPKKAPEIQHSPGNMKIDKQTTRITETGLSVAQEQVIKEQTKQMRVEIQPLFEACRAFSGKVLFKLQLGQALILKNTTLRESKYFTTSDWTNLFRAGRMPPIGSLFTNIITDNGVEVDNLLQMKAFDKKSKLWSPNLQTTTVVEFLCQDTSGQIFNILVSSHGSHQLLKECHSIGKVALHHPGQIWDACAVLEGENVWNTAPDNVVDGVRELMDSLFIPPKLKATVYFRQPPNSAFVVRDVSVRRTTTHACLDKTHVDCELQTTEVKNLVHCSHPADKKLYRSSEHEYSRMVKSGRIHYEIAIVSKSINDCFDQFNSNLSLGDLTPADVTGRNLANFGVLQKLIRVSSYVIGKIDWMGAENYGTCRQAIEEAQYQQSLIQESMPPQIAAQIHQGTLLPSTINQRPSVIRGTMTTSSQVSLPGSLSMASVLHELPPIPGVRAGTTAPLYRQGGRLFRLGIGGARVPVQEVDDLVLPDDSASQVGNRVAGRRPGVNAGSVKPHEKPASFW